MGAEIEAARADLTTRSFFLFFNSQAALVSRSMTKRLRDGVGWIQGSFQAEVHRCSTPSAAIHTYSRCEINTTTTCIISPLPRPLPPKKKPSNPFTKFAI